MDDLIAICSLYCPDVICIVETWLDDTIFNSEIFIQGYVLCRLNRSRHNGGILIFVNSSFTFSLLFKGTPEFACVSLSVNNCSVSHNSPDSAFAIALFYRPPNSSQVLLDILFSTLCSCYVLSPSKIFSGW